MAGFGTTEMVLIIVMVIFLFGLGRISRLGGELGSANLLIWSGQDFTAWR